MKIESGSHLSTVREFIKQKARNGNTVEWGSLDYLELNSLTVIDMERLSQEIRNSVRKEILQEVRTAINLEFIKLGI